MTEKKGAALPVRLTEYEKNQLNAIAEATGLTASTLIRLLVDALIRDFQDGEKKLVLPLSLMRLLAADTQSK